MSDLRAVARNWLPALDPCELFRRSGMEPDPWQTELLRSTSKRILLNASRQAGKSSATAARGLWEALFSPGSLILLVSVSQRQSAELLRRVKDLYRPFADAFPTESETVLQLELRNGSRILSLPSDSGTLRGYSGPSLVVLDEASRVRDEVLDALTPMLATSEGTLIALSTPAGKRGVFYRLWTEGGPAWERYTVRANDCPRHSAAFLEEERRRMGDRIFEEEYGAAFVDDEEDHGNPRLLSPETIAALRAQLPDDDEPGARPS